jgi:hypothetical protein
MFLSQIIKAALFIDSYWLVGRGGQPDDTLIRAEAQTAERGVSIERVYWYLESEDVPNALQVISRLSVRTCARDYLDHSFELIRAMEADLIGVADSKVYDAVIIASLDDRLALSIERVKTLGVLVIGCYGGNNEADRRMLRLFDEVIETRFGEGVGEELRREVVVSVETRATIRDAINQWRKDSDDFARDRTIAFVRSRSRLPRPVDSRLLFLTSHLLGRELTEGEKIAMRHEFRVALH